MLRIINALKLSPPHWTLKSRHLQELTFLRFSENTPAGGTLGKPETRDINAH